MNRRAFLTATAITGATATQSIASCCAASIQGAAGWSAIDKKLNDEFGGERPGCFALALTGGEEVFSRGYGMADLENRTPMTEHTIFRIASLTKPLTAGAVLTLVQDGFINVDDAIGNHLDKVPAIWREITIRQLLGHTSGISGDIERLFSRSREDLTPLGLINLYADLPLIAAPGAAWFYSNVNYWLLGMLIEAKSGLSYADYLKNKIFRRAGMNSTQYGEWAPIVPHRAHGYSRSRAGELINARYFSRTLGFSAGGVLSTPRDMASFCIALSDGRILPPDLIRAMLTPTQTTGGGLTKYGLGWFADGKNDDHLVYHGGTSLGFVSYLIWRPSTGAVVALFSNNGAIAEPKAMAEMMFRLTE